MRKVLILGFGVLIAACGTNKDEPSDSNGEKATKQKETLAKPGSAAPASESTLASAGKEVKVTALSISEHRYVQLEKTKNDFMTGGSGTTIELLVKGEAVARATRVGNVEIAKAEDDLGNSLAPERQSILSSGMESIDRDSRFGRPQADDETQVNLNLKASSRSASSIAVLEGSLTLSVAKVTKVEVPGSELRKLLGKKIENAILTNAGITVEVAKLSEAGTLITLKVVDKKESITATNVVSAKGERLDNGYSSSGFGDVRTTELFGDGTLSDDAKLVLAVETQRQDMEVPFKFQNIQLP